MNTLIIIVFITIIIFYIMKMQPNTYYIEPFNQPSIEQIKERVLGLTEKKMMLTENYQHIKGLIMTNYRLDCPKTTPPPISMQEKEMTQEPKDKLTQIANLVQNKLKNKDDVKQLKQLVGDFLYSGRYHNI